MLPSVKRKTNNICSEARSCVTPKYHLTRASGNGNFYTLNIESLMSCHLLLNLLHELANMILCEALPSIISFLPTNVINLVINDNEFEILFIT